MREFAIKAADPEQGIGGLSGGNQQKVVVGRWMEHPPRILILDEPTRGVDVGAREEMFGILRRLVEAGMAVILISSDLPEVMGLSHRLALYRDGRIVREVPASEATAEDVMAELTRKLSDHENRQAACTRSWPPSSCSWRCSGSGCRSSSRSRTCWTWPSRSRSTPILAFGMTLVILIGGIDLSVGAVVALIGTLTVWLLPRVGLAGAVPRAWRRPSVFGASTASAPRKTAMPPFIITLATMLVARGTALRFNEGRPIPVPASQEAFLALGNARVLRGRARAGAGDGGGVRRDRRAAPSHPVRPAPLRHRRQPRGGPLHGIPLARNEIAVYVACSLLAGLAGMIHASQLYSAEPGSGQGFELNAIAAVVVGGTSFTGGIGTMPGTLLGAIIIGILDKGLNQAGVHFSLQYIVKGLVILAAVYIDVRRRAGRH